MILSEIVFLASKSLSGRFYLTFIQLKLCENTEKHCKCVSYIFDNVSQYSGNT